MKPVKNLVSALLLVFAITTSICAGEMPIPPAPEPQPRATAVAPEADPSPSGDSYYEQSGETTETSDYLLFEAIAALLSVY